MRQSPLPLRRPVEEELLVPLALPVGPPPRRVERDDSEAAPAPAERRVIIIDLV